MNRKGRCPAWTRAPGAPPRPPAPPPARNASLQWRRPAAAAGAAPEPRGPAPAAPLQAPPQLLAAAPERAYRRAGRASNALVRAVTAPAAAAAVPPRAGRYIKPSAHSLLRSLPAGASPAPAPAPAPAPRRVAAGRVRKPPLARAAPRVRLLSAHERGVVVRQLRGQQNCALLYRRTGGGFALRREGVRGGAGGAHMTWTSRAQPRLRAAAAGAAARAAASVTAPPPQPPPQPRARSTRRKSSATAVLATRGAPVTKAQRAKLPGAFSPVILCVADAKLSRHHAAGGGAGGGAAPLRAALHLRALCLPFCRTGRCRKPAGACPLRHDVDKVAVCHRWLKGACTDAACPLTHKARVRVVTASARASELTARPIAARRSFPRACRCATCSWRGDAARPRARTRTSTSAPLRRCAPPSLPASARAAWRARCATLGCAPRCSATAAAPTASAAGSTTRPCASVRAMLCLLPRRQTKRSKTSAPGAACWCRRLRAAHTNESRTMHTSEMHNRSLLSPSAACRCDSACQCGSVKAAAVASARSPAVLRLFADAVEAAAAEAATPCFTERRFGTRR